MQRRVADFIQSHTSETYNIDEEFFWIDSTEIQYVRNPTQVVYLADDIQEYASLPTRTQLGDILWSQASALVLEMGEKCTVDVHEHTGQPRREDCELCSIDNLARMCIPKLFRALDSAFIPLPHGGMEFGDAGLSITLAGSRRMFVGIAKSSKSSRSRAMRQIAVGDSVGKEMLQQALRQAISDQRVEVFGIVTPRPLDPELHGTVRLLSKMSHKPVVFFGHDELTRMCGALLRGRAA